MNEETFLPMTGAEAMSEMLLSCGAEYIFGIGGFQFMPFCGGLCRGGSRRPRYLPVNDERTGGLAANACARVSEKAGFGDGTLGPGVDARAQVRVKPGDTPA